MTQRRGTPLKPKEAFDFAEHVFHLHGALQYLLADIKARSTSEPGTESTRDPRAPPDSAQWVAEEIAAVVADARDSGVDGETIVAQLEHAAAALREGLT